MWLNRRELNRDGGRLKQRGGVQKLRINYATTDLICHELSCILEWGSFLENWSFKGVGLLERGFIRGGLKEAPYSFLKSRKHSFQIQNLVH